MKDRPKGDTMDGDIGSVTGQKVTMDIHPAGTRRTTITIDGTVQNIRGRRRREEREGGVKNKESLKTWREG